MYVHIRQVIFPLRYCIYHPYTRCFQTWLLQRRLTFKKRTLLTNLWNLLLNEMNTLIAFRNTLYLLKLFFFLVKWIY